MDEQLRESPLADCHQEYGARMVPFAGWKMPVQYEGIIPEHRAVRSGLGVFDISHMGQFFASGTAESPAGWLNGLLTNDASRLKVGDGQYTFLLNEAGGVIDDLIVYRFSSESYFLVVNAARTEEDFGWMSDRKPSAGITLTDESSKFAGLAVQGPHTESAVTKIFGPDIRLPARFCMSRIECEGQSLIVCRTGYTGEDGFELFCPIEHAATWWQKIVTAGAIPCGLGARDSLRLEKCYPLNGSDLHRDKSPLAAGMGFAVALDKPEFIGRERLVREKEHGLSKKLVAIRQTEKSPPPRPGYAVFCDGNQVGELTSGGVSPELGCGISLAYLDHGFHRRGTEVELEIRGRRFPGEVVRKPFV